MCRSLPAKTLRFPLPPKPNSNPNGSFSTLRHHCLSLLNSSPSTPQLLQIHARILTSGLSADHFLTALLLRFYSLSASPNLPYARSLLARSPNPPLSSYNLLIRGHSQSNSPGQALTLFVEIRRRQMVPNELTYPFVVKSCARLSELRFGIQVHADVLKNGVDSVVYVRNALMHLYGACRLIEGVCKVFDEMPRRTVVSWNTVLSACVDNYMSEDCIGLFVWMRNDEFEPDQTTFVVLLSAAAELGSLGFGRWAHSQMVGRGLHLNVQLGTALVNMYTKCGAVGPAKLIFDGMAVRNVWTWSAMILGFAQHGSAREALELFSEMKDSSIEPNYVTFLGVLCACSHSGLVEDGYRFFHEMVHVYGIQPMMTHYSAMVDVLGRKGHLLEAYNFVCRMPVEADAVVWRTLLSACQSHSANDTTGIGEKARRRLLVLEPRRSGNYVMIANMYSEAGSWNDAAKVRRVMREEGLKKMAAESCVEVGGLTHRFVSGDDSCTHDETITHLLDGLNLNMRMVGSENANFVMNSTEVV